MTDHFENPETILNLTAHYTTPKGRDGQKTFSSPEAYQRWANQVEQRDYDINCIDIERYPTTAETPKEIFEQLVEQFLKTDGGRRILDQIQKKIIDRGDEFEITSIVMDMVH